MSKMFTGENQTTFQPQVDSRTAMIQDVTATYRNHYFFRFPAYKVAVP